MPYKLTDENGMTRNGTQWKPGAVQRAVGTSDRLCSDGWIHFYTNPLIAVFMNPAHANFKKPRMFSCRTIGEVKHEALKSGARGLQVLKEIKIPEVTLVQKVAFGILCSLEVYKEQKYVVWADNWLIGKDRSKESAYVAYVAYVASNVAYAYANANAAYVAYAYANANANAAYVADAAANYAANIADAAANYAADYAASNYFVALAKKAMTYS